MSYAEASAFLEALGIDAMKSMAPSLHRIQALCEALGHPERSLQAIHVTGTNGKTSTARIASAIVTATGLNVATYTSPHLESIRERLVLNGKPIEESEFGEVFSYLHPYLDLVQARLDEELTFFEVLTGMFFVWAAENADASVVEVGLGGTWDATNVIDAQVAVITSIGLDHTQLLGAERSTIAAEKVGIVKPSAIAVTGERSPEILKVLQAHCDEVHAQLVPIERDFRVTENRIAVGGRYLSIETTSGKYSDLFLPLHGSHQGLNAATALEAVTRFLPLNPPGEDVVAEGFAKTVVPGRLETVKLTDAGARVVMDVAHNPDGMSALVSSLIEAFAFDRALIVVGILADKDYLGMLTELKRLPCSLVVTQAATVRSVPLDALAEAARALEIECAVVDDVATAVKSTLEATVEGELVCITGSHYVVGEARSYLLGP